MSISSCSFFFFRWGMTDPIPLEKGLALDNKFENTSLLDTLWSINCGCQCHLGCSKHLSVPKGSRTRRTIAFWLGGGVGGNFHPLLSVLKWLELCVWIKTTDLLWISWLSGLLPWVSHNQKHVTIQYCVFNS